MNLKWQLTGAFLLSLVSALAFACVAVLVGDQKVAQFDDAIISYVQSFESPAVTAIMKCFTFIGSAPAVGVLSVGVLFLLYKVFKHRSELVLFLAVVGGEALLNLVLKQLFHRARPTLHRLIEETGYSFPSGHSMTAFAFYGVVAFLLWRHIDSRMGRGLLIVFSLVMTLLIGISRIYLGVHYPSDVLGGYLASAFWLAAAVWFYQRYMERLYEKSQ